MEKQLECLKCDIRGEIAGVKLRRRHHIRSKILKADPNRKKFWRFLKSQVKSAGNITAAYAKSGNMVFEQSDIEDAILDYFETIFKGKRVPVFPASDEPSQTSQALLSLQNNSLSSLTLMKARLS